MIPKTGNVSLLQALADCDIPVGNSSHKLNNSVFRDRLLQASGSISLNSLRGIVTAMHTQKESGWSPKSTSRMEGHPKTYLDSANRLCQILGDYQTKLGLEYTKSGGAVEFLQHGYCEPGSYKLDGIWAAGGLQYGNFAYRNVDVIACSSGFLNGSSEVLVNIRNNTTSKRSFSESFNIVKGKQYITVALRQHTYISSGDFWNGTFQNVRVTKA